jgi:nucleotide-binding universal stress UspA family protein
MRILAAIDNSAASWPVLATAVEIGRLLDASVEAVHVQENGAETAIALAERARVELRLIRYAPVETLIETLDAEDVALAVVGARGLPGGAKPAGHIALAVVERVTKPVVVVPPDAAAPKPGGVRRVLVPINDHPSSADATAAAIRLLGRSDVEILAVHVFEPRTTPLFLDHPVRDLELWSAELLQRVVAKPDVPVTIRTGDAGQNVLEEAVGQRVDMIALGWSQDFSAGHARTVREILSRSEVPVLLLPVAVEQGAATPDDRTAAVGGRAGERNGTSGSADRSP